MHMEIGASILAANSPSPAFFTPKAPHCAPPTITCRGCWDIMLRATRCPTIEAHGRSGQGSEQGYTSRQDTLPRAYQPPCTLTHTVPGFASFSQAHWPAADYVAHRSGSRRALFLQSKLHFEIKLGIFFSLPIIIYILSFVHCQIVHYKMLFSNPQSKLIYWIHVLK